MGRRYRAEAAGAAGAGRSPDPGRAAAKTARQVAIASRSDMAAVSSFISSLEEFHACNTVPAHSVAQSS